MGKIFSLLQPIGCLLLAFVCWVVLDQLAVKLADIFVVGRFQFLWLTVHHLIQLALVVLVMILPIWKMSLADWGWNIRNKEDTFNTLKSFVIGWLFFSTVFIVIREWLGDWPPLLNFQLSTGNVLWYLFFELVIVGFAEEAMFRGLVYGILKPQFSQIIDLKLFQVSVAGVISSIFFMLAHIEFDFAHLKVVSIDPMQLIVALALGLFYVILRERTDSLLGPILAHNITDGSLSIVYLLLHFFVIH